jgi:hypothetical protein
MAKFTGLEANDWSGMLDTWWSKASQARPFRMKEVNIISNNHGALAAGNPVTGLTRYRHKLYSPPAYPEVSTIVEGTLMLSNIADAFPKKAR